MPSRIIVIHGTYGNPNENWIPWLSEELKSRGHTMITPQFPTPSDQSLASWKRAFWRDSGLIDEKTILVGHSIGAAFILNTAMTLFKPMRGAFLIAPFVSALGNPEFDPLNASFLSMGFDWSLINKTIGKVKVYHSDNDPYVPINYAKEVTVNLGIQATLVPGAGHFNEASGYTKFDILLADILAIA